MLEPEVNRYLTILSSRAQLDEHCLTEIYHVMCTQKSIACG